MSFGLKVTGDLAKQIEQYKLEAGVHIESAVKITAMEVLSDSVKSIQRGSKTGKIYKRAKGYHQASAPGEAPASDTGRLAGSIDINRLKDLIYQVGTNLDYGVYLEYGTMDIAERPWLRPAVEMNRDFFNQRLTQAIRAASK